MCVFYCCREANFCPAAKKTKHSSSAPHLSLQSSELLANIQTKLLVCTIKPMRGMFLLKLIILAVFVLWSYEYFLLFGFMSWTGFWLICLAQSLFEHIPLFFLILKSSKEDILSLPKHRTGERKYEQFLFFLFVFFAKNSMKYANKINRKHNFDAEFNSTAKM